ncbi:MAG: flavodoxin family protein [Lachnospiraceae bacterium]|nr:flavodoxin family protein [Lachnospiraceae bacterium]
MKILVLNGSPKAKSDTMHLTNAFLDGIAKKGVHEIEIVNVIEKNIKPCMGCFACWKLQNGKCIQNDDQNDILSKIIANDIIIWSFPLYCYSMPSHLKAVVDRTIPLAKMSMKEENGIVRHDTLVDLSKKRYVVISGCGFPNWDGNFDGLKLQCRNMFGKDVTMVCVPETPMLNEPTAAPLTGPLLEKFVAAGEEYAEHLALSEETINSLEMPMLPNDIYIQIVNGNAGQ